MGTHSLQIASYEKPDMSESLGGNDLKFRLFGRASGWSMTLKMEPKLIKMQFFLQKTYHHCGNISSLRPHIYTQTRHKVQGVITLKN